MNDTDVAARLAEALMWTPAASDNLGKLYAQDRQAIVAALLPVVREIADQRAAEAVRPFDELFAGGPDTSCRTTWRRDSLADMPGTSTECVEVPMDDLRDAFDRAAALRGEAGR